MKLLPYQDDNFSKYRNESVQEIRFALSSQIREQIFFTTFIQNAETIIKSNAVTTALKKLFQQQGLIS